MTMKQMGIKEFRDFGYLQELNRQFLHPLGLALFVTVDDETDEVTLGGVFDFRDDPEGMAFGDGQLDFQKYIRVHYAYCEKADHRTRLFGAPIQPFPPEQDDID